MVLIAISFQCVTSLACAAAGPATQNERKCNEKWQNWYFFKLSYWIHCCSFLCETCAFVASFHRHKRKRAIKVII